MPDAICTATKSSGEPCKAAALPGRSFCPFHAPEHADRFAEGRSKGGATPRRRIRRFPVILDHLHVDELLSELFVEAMNHPESIDPKRLQAITALACMLLKAVGVPPSAASCFQHAHRSEPPATAEHLVRIYLPLPDEEEALLETAPSAAGEPIDPRTPTARASEMATFPASQNPSTQEIPCEIAAPDRLIGQDMEQVINKSPTSPPATEHIPDPGLTAPITPDILLSLSPTDGTPLHLPPASSDPSIIPDGPAATRPRRRSRPFG